MSKVRTITVNALTRVEGEGALHVRVHGNEIENVKLSIYEPPRFFEAFLRGRSIEEVPDLTARICGICPIAYQMTSVHAIENILGLRITEEIRRLRRLLYCAEWIESHVLHIYLLNAPDFFNCQSGIELAAKFPDEVNRGLRMRKAGNRVLEVLGGRAIHPVNVRVGGFYGLPHADELASLLPELRWGLEAAIESAKWVASFDFPAWNFDCELVALQHPHEYPMNEGDIASTRSPTIHVSDYETHFGETQVEHSTAYQSTRREGASPYLLGPLSRLNLNRETLSERTQELVQTLCPQFPSQNRFHSIIARSIEVVHAFDESIGILESYSPPSEYFIDYKPQAGSGCAATEAPRGMMYHHYVIDDEGRVVESKIVPPTSQNQLQIETDLREYLPRLLDETDQRIAHECEKLIRNYDPCISCSTHFMTLNLERI